MTPATPSTTPSPLPGSWDVGLALHSAWDHVLVLSLVLLVVAVGGLVVLASRRDGSEQSEWQAWLEGRSLTHREEEPDTHARVGLAAARSARDR